MTLGLFGPERPWERLLDDQPIVAGRHPLHLYHGYLGARTLRERGTLSCYDPSFHAGYPKTPVFDSGSRPAELALTLAGASYRPAAYKVGYALLWVLAPLVLFFASRAVGMGRGSACLSSALGLLVWWGQPCQDALEAGDVDLLLATLVVLAQAGLLIRYHRAPCPLSLAGVVLTGLLGWFSHPLLLALLFPLFLIYYLSAGTRHRLLAWHVPLLGGLLGAIGVNAFWLLDWVHYWWIRVPLHLDSPLLAHRTLRTFWEAPLWGGPVDKALACLLAGAAAVGVLLYNGNGQRATARLLGLGWAGFLALAVLGIAWEPLGSVGAAHLLVPALLFAAVPAAHGLAEGLGRVRCWGGTAVAPLTLAAGAIGLAWLAAPGPVGAWAARLTAPRPLELGLDGERTALVEVLREHTTDQARILWEDRRGGPLGSHWSALLPLLTGRAFVGGLDPDAGIEHATGGLIEETLAGRPLADWADSDLADYCRRYNIGWVACWSPEARARFRKWARAEVVAGLAGAEGEPGQLFRVRRRPSFALTGSVQWRGADPRHILLGEAVPERGPGDEGEGQIVLSLHYQAGMRVTPSRVRIERALDPNDADAIPFVRLRLRQPVGRILITWEGR